MESREASLRLALIEAGLLSAEYLAEADLAVNLKLPVAYVTDKTHFLLDIDGYFVPAGTDASGLEFFPVTPCRFADTRDASGPLGGPSLTGGVGDIPVLSGSRGIPATARAYSLNAGS